MAALCPGVQYGLSSQQNFGEHKDLIFVKLTDSALRAIEDYIKNQNKFAYQNPRIRFLGNENGELSFPSQHHTAGCVSFNFAMSTTADMEGPGGSFECVHGTPPRGPLENLGTIPYKIRVHANEDVYEATRNRMNEVEDKYKNKCTREIKPNQTDIGRKVKVKQTAPSRAPPPSQRGASSLPSMRDSLLKHAAAPPSSYQPASKAAPPPPQPPPSAFQPAAASAAAHSNGLGSNHVSSSQRASAASASAAAVQHNKKPSVPDVARRPLRERLIHLLALRPLKKIELHDRLTKEGVRGSNSMTTVLKQIAHMKDNCYHLNRNVWNEVNDEWPFYTETEKQVLKRRKPQNLTPPGGSDGGSSGSGQSPTSTHPGSPPLITSSNGTKRPGFHEGADGFPYKRQRIAHGSAGNNAKFPVAGAATLPPLTDNHHPSTYPAARQPEFPAYRQSDQAYGRSPIVEQQNSQRRPATDLRDASNMNPRSRESPTTNGYHHSNGYDGSPPDDEKKRQQSCDSLTYVVGRDKGPFRNGSPVNNRLLPAPLNGSTLNDKERRNGGHRVSSSSSSRSQRIARVSPDSQTEMVTTDAQPVRPTKQDVAAPPADVDDDFPDYKTQYVTITSREQRRRYKADFNADYAEYRDLHGIVDKVSKRFVQLEERLKQEGENSPRYKDIKKQVVREYQENKKDAEHQRAKKRFHYLHEKLSHIKRLVNEYDQTMVGVVDC